MGFFSAGGGLTKGSKRALNDLRGQIYQGRDEVSALIDDFLMRSQESNAAIGSNLAARSNIAAARFGPGLSAGASNSAGIQGYLNALPAILQNEQQANQLATQFGIQNTEDFINALSGYTQMRLQKKKQGLGSRLISGAVGGLAGAGLGFLTGGPKGAAAGGASGFGSGFNSGYNG